MDGSGDSPTNFCMLKRTGGVDGVATTRSAPAERADSLVQHLQLRAQRVRDAPAAAGRPLLHPVPDRRRQSHVARHWFDTVDRERRSRASSFYAQETGVNTGVFQLNLNSILDDLGFNSLRVRDVLVAYYLDPNDEDDFQVAAAYIESKETSITSFTDATRAGQGALLARPRPGVRAGHRRERERRPVLPGAGRRPHLRSARVRTTPSG